MLKKGDVIFIADTSEVNISNLSKGYNDYSFYHCCLYIGKNQIIEALTNNGVIIDDLDKYNKNIKLISRVNENTFFIEKVINQAKKFVGYKYNNLFLPNLENKLYCSELIHQAFKFANNNKFYFEEHTLNYIDLVTNKIPDYWLNLYKRNNIKIPQGQKGSHPNNLSLDNRFIFRKFVK